MADETPGRVAATLAAIRERNEQLRTRYGYVGGLLELAKAKDDVPRLLAAVEAALGLAAGWKQIPFAVRASDECADELREAITTALTGHL